MNYKIVLSADAKEDLDYFKTHPDQRLRKKINQIFRSLTVTPFSGIGQPERLRGNLSGFMSRRINREHRIVYYVEPDKVCIVSLRGHYF